MSSSLESLKLEKKKRSTLGVGGHVRRYKLGSRAMAAFQVFETLNGIESVAPRGKYDSPEGWLLKVKIVLSHPRWVRHSSSSSKGNKTLSLLYTFFSIARFPPFSAEP